jgi:misacylated tRNA(Ala) deacylase
MTELLYMEDSYSKDFEAEIVSVDRDQKAIILDRTAFYPGGGGQLCDIGTITSNEIEYKIVKVKKFGDEVYHFTDGDLPKSGNLVQGNIDWERRYKLMRTHSAMHVVCGVMWNDHNSMVTGGNMDILSARMDFELENLDNDMLPEIEKRVNEEIAKEHNIVAKILPRQEAFQIPDLIRTKINLLPEGINTIRTIDIVGLDLQADGGTHVSNTKEIGRVHIVKFKNKGKINKRLYVSIDEN